MNIVAKTLNYLWLHGWQYRATERCHARLVERLKGKHPVSVVFMAIDLAYWRYQHLYELMAADERFDVHIVLSPCLERQHKEQDMERLRQYFRHHDIAFIDYDFQQKPFDIRGQLNPDIIFFAQPYEHLLCREHDCLNFYDRLTCYMPYAFWTSTGKLSYNLHFHNRAWRLYYSTELHRKEAQQVADNRGRNVRVVGYANADDYLCGHYDEKVWKQVNDGRQRKRIIWAPHFSIIEKNSALPPRSNFLWMAPLMLTIAQKYADRLQIAFKPHPSLLTQLYQHPDWGQQRTDEYYRQWQTMDNTQLEAGAYTDLFMTSDAMIHDSGSFVVEYLYAHRPVMFISKNLKPILDTQSEFGRKAYEQSYIGQTEADICQFIDHVVLANEDPMHAQRQQFFENYLLPPGQKSVAQNIIEDLTEALAL